MSLPYFVKGRFVFWYYHCYWASKTDANDR